MAGLLLLFAGTAFPQISGRVTDRQKKPVPYATVLLYDTQEDSAVFQELPFAATKTDDWGYFALRNLPARGFRMYAISDENGNNRYDPDTESIAFIDSLIKPVNVIRDSVYELIFFDMKDTLACRDRKTEYELSMFKETPSRQYIDLYGRRSERSAFVSFSARNAHIDTMWIAGLSPDRLITQINLERDSLEIWMNDQRNIPDTVLLFVNYLKTDSTGVRSGFTEEIKLGNENPRAPVDTIAKMDLTVDPKRVETEGFILEFGYPVINAQFDSISLVVTDLHNVDERGSISYYRDSLNLRKYHIMPEGKMSISSKYTLTIPKGIFRDINNAWNDSTQVTVSLPIDVKLSTLQLDLKNVNHKYIVEMLDERRTQTLFTHVVNQDKMVEFPYLTAGKYYIRITEDLNGNSYVDTGSLLDHQMPERVKYFKIDDNPLLDIPEMSFISQTVDLEQMF